MSKFGGSLECGCKNGGSCYNDMCHCPVGYSGKRCEVPSCRPKCLHGGVCVDVNVCSCKNGYTGARCQTGNQALFPIIFVVD